MTVKKEYHLNIPVFRVVNVTALQSLFLISGNTFVVFNVLTGKQETHTIKELEVILDLEWHEGLVYVVGMGNIPLIYNLKEQRVVGRIGVPDEKKNAYSAIKRVGDYFFCANFYSELAEAWKNGNELAYTFVGGNFIKRIEWEEHSRTLIVVLSESEDSGNLLFYHLDEEGKLHGLNVVVDCYFAVSNIAFSSDRKELFIAGGFPPLDVQVYSFPELDIKKEFVLAEDYPKDQFGNEIGHAFNLEFQLTDKNEILFPYSGGAVLSINSNNQYRILFDNGETWIYIKLFAGELIGITHEGGIYLFDHDFKEPLQPEKIAIEDLTTIFEVVEPLFPLTHRDTIDPPEEADELVLVR